MRAARTLALGGADIIAHPSNLVLPHCPRAMPVRALENHVFTATANRIGTESNGKESLTFIGQSVICSPGGEVLVTGRAAAEMLTGTVAAVHTGRPLLLFAAGRVPSVVSTAITALAPSHVILCRKGRLP